MKEYQSKGKVKRKLAWNNNKGEKEAKYLIA